MQVRQLLAGLELKLLLRFECFSLLEMRLSGWQRLEEPYTNFERFGHQCRLN